MPNTFVSFLSHSEQAKWYHETNQSIKEMRLESLVTCESLSDTVCLGVALSGWELATGETEKLK